MNVQKVQKPANDRREQLSCPNNVDTSKISATAQGVSDESMCIGRAHDKHEIISSGTNNSAASLHTLALKTVPMRRMSTNLNFMDPEEWLGLQHKAVRDDEHDMNALHTVTPIYTKDINATRNNRIQNESRVLCDDRIKGEKDAGSPLQCTTSTTKTPYIVQKMTPITCVLAPQTTTSLNDMEPTLSLMVHQITQGLPTAPPSPEEASATATSMDNGCTNPAQREYKVENLSPTSCEQAPQQKRTQEVHAPSTHDAEADTATFPPKMYMDHVLDTHDSKNVSPKSCLLARHTTVSLNDMDPEDWLKKQQAKQDHSTSKCHDLTTCTDISPEHRSYTNPASQEFDVENALPKTCVPKSINDENPECCMKKQDSTRQQQNRFEFQLWKSWKSDSLGESLSRNLSTFRSFTTTLNDSNDDTSSFRGDGHIGTSNRHFVSARVQRALSTSFGSSDEGGDSDLSHDHFIPASLVDDVILVKGEVSQDAKHRRKLLLMSCFAAVVMTTVIVVVSVVVSTNMRSTRNSRIDLKGPPSEDIMSPRGSSPTLAPSIFLSPTVDFLNQTIAGRHSVVYEHNPALGILLQNFDAIPVGGEFMENLNRPDKNFTFFAISSNAFSEFADHRDLLLKFFDPTFSGHVLDALESIVIEDQVLRWEDLVDGLILTAKSGALLTVTVSESDVQINGIRLDRLASNVRFSNGFLHTLDQFPFSSLTWFEKSNYDILLETNEKRNGDLSRFIGLINATDLKDMWQGSNVSTVFCFTNEAMSLVELEDPDIFDWDNSTGMIDKSSQLYQLLLNHMAIGVFAQNAWEKTGTGKILNETQLQVETGAAKQINLVIEPGKDVIINGKSKVIQADLFSESGVIHVIDRLLLL